MEFIKKQSVGFFMTLLALLLSSAGFIFYLINCHTSYFLNRGIDSKIIVSFLAAIILELAFILGTEILGSKIVLDILPVAVSVLLVIAFVAFLGSRVAGIASIMTFENNAKTMADLSSAMTGLICSFLALVLSIIASFFKVIKE
jgi:hypothetical protein